MATMFCPDCNADLDRVPVKEACPGCGGGRRSARVELPTAYSTAKANEVQALVQDALDELAAMPAEVAETAFKRVVALAGSAHGTSSSTATLTVAWPVERSISAQASAVVAVADFVADATFLPAEAIQLPPAWLRAWRNPDARAVLNNLASNGLYDLLKLGVGAGIVLYLGAKVSCGGSALMNVELHLHVPPAAVDFTAPTSAMRCSFARKALASPSRQVRQPPWLNAATSLSLFSSAPAAFLAKSFRALASSSRSRSTSARSWRAWAASSWSPA
jgi:hypothetical protein